MTETKARLANYCLRAYVADLLEATKHKDKLKPEFFDFIGAVARLSLQDECKQSITGELYYDVISLYDKSESIDGIMKLCQLKYECHNPMSSWGSVKRRCCDRGIIPHRVAQYELANRKANAVIYVNPSSAKLIELYKKHVREIDQDLLDNAINLEGRIKNLKEEIILRRKKRKK